MNLTEKLRSGHVRRWHIVAVAREQTIADHMYRVGVIAEEILKRLGMFDWDSNLTLNVMRWAAIHDRHEFRLGDLPTPGKDAIRMELVGTYGGDAITLAAAKLDPEAEELRQCVEQGGECPLAGHIVKYADLLEAMNYVGIFGCGRHAREVWGELQHLAMSACATIIDHETIADDRAEAMFELIHLLREGQHWS